MRDPHRFPGRHGRHRGDQDRDRNIFCRRSKNAAAQKAIAATAVTHATAL